MARLTTADDIPSGPASVGDARPSIWSAIHPRLLELIRAHRSTLIFVNSRRLAERLAGALNELAGETLVRSHHGSIARPQRVEVEDLLKAGALRALVATSSLELGIDMGAIDLVVQIEAPPSVASGLQRIGRGGHQVERGQRRRDLPEVPRRPGRLRRRRQGDARRRGRSDPLSAQPARHRRAADRRDDGDGRLGRRRAVRDDPPRGAVRRVEPRGVRRRARHAVGPLSVRRVRRAAAARHLGSRRRHDRRRAKAPSAWRSPTAARFPTAGCSACSWSAPARARRASASSTKRWCSRAASARPSCSAPRRGASRRSRTTACWCRPRPGEPGKMPFWKGDRAGRPLELGLAIGRLMHDLLRLPPAAAIDRLTREHDLDARAAENLLQYLRDQMAAARAVPDASTDRRRARARRARRLARLRAVAARRPHSRAVGDGGRREDPRGDRRRRRDAVGRRWVRGAVSGRGPAAGSAAAAARSRRSAGAGRAAARRDGAVRGEVPRERRRARCCCRSGGPGMRAPLWQQRKRAADLLAVASRYGSFPVLLETYRECLRDFFDMPALVSTLADIRSRKHPRRDRRLRDSRRRLPRRCSSATSPASSTTATRRSPSAARRRSRSIRRSCASCSATPSCASCSTPTSMDAIERQLQRLDPKYHAQERRRRARHAAVARRSDRATSCASAPRPPDVAGSVGALVAARRVAAGADRRRAALHRGRRRGALPRRARRAAAARHARVAARSRCAIRSAISRCATRARTRRSPPPTSRRATGSASPAAEARADAPDRAKAGWSKASSGPAARGANGPTPACCACCAAARSPSCATKSSRSIRRCSAGSRRRGRGSSSGAAAPTRCSTPSSSCRARRCRRRSSRPRSCRRGSTATTRPISTRSTAAGEVVWVGVEPLGERDGRVALYLADHLPRLLPPSRRRPDARRTDVEPSAAELADRERAILDALRDARRVVLRRRCTRRSAAAIPAETVDALWNLVWRGLVTNDTFHALRAFTRARAPRRRRAARAERAGVPLAAAGAAVGRRTLDAGRDRRGTQRQPRRPPRRRARRRGPPAIDAATARAPRRLTREAVAAEAHARRLRHRLSGAEGDGGSGRIRRGYFVAGLGATQFALPGALDLLRSLRDAADDADVVVLAATDPANPYGATLKWPQRNRAASTPSPPSTRDSRRTRRTRR